MSPAHLIVLLSVEDARHPPDVAAVGGRVTRCFPSSRVCLVEGAQPEALRGLPGVRRAERDGILVQANGATVGPTADCPDPYELEAIEVQTAWDLGVCGQDAVISVMDSGFRATHHDLVGQIVGQYDYGEDDPVAEVELQAGVPEHGTFIAGILAALADDAGRTGVAPDGGLFVQKIADQSGALLFSYAIAAMDDLVASHPEVRVVNYSIAGDSAPQAFSDAVEALGAADIVLVASASNCVTAGCADANNDLNPTYPASYAFEHVLAVASTRADGSLDPFSHFGPVSVDVAAPGTEICSLGIANDDAVQVSSGTSFAAPVVAGVASLVRQRWPRLTAGEVVALLTDSCAPDAGLTGRVTCAGTVSAARALARPVVTVDAPAAVVAPGTWTITGDSRAAGGTVFGVITHPSEVATDGFGTPFVAGDEIPWPSGARAADADGTWFEAPLPADGPLAIAIPWVATAAGDGAGELALELAGGDQVVDGGTFALSFTATVPPPETTDTGTRESPPTPAPDDGCGCGRTPGSGAGALLLLGLIRRRRAAAAP